MIVQFKSSTLIIVFMLVCLTSALSFAEEVEKWSLIDNRKTGLNSGNYNNINRVTKLVYEVESLPNPITSQKGHISQRQPADKRLIQDFVLYSYAHLADNIINGKGIYLESLFSLLDIKAEKKATSINNMLQILVENERILDFANGIANYYAIEE